MPLVSQTFDQLLDFTRTTSGTFVGSNGLIQTTPASVNLLLWTQQFDNAAWTKSNSTVTANTTVAPDGTSTADAAIPTTTPAVNKFVQQTFTTYASGTTYTHSVYAKAFGYTGLQIVLPAAAFAGPPFANFDLANGIASVTYPYGGSGATATITNVGDGWYRCSVTMTATGTAATAAQLRIMNTYTTTDTTFTANGTSGIFVWGAQLEAASAATTYTRNNGGVFPPRFDYDPVTLAPKGLLVEEQRTNLVTYSEQFDNASWTKLNATVTANAATAPDGTSAADFVVPDTTNNQHGVFKSVTTASGTAYTHSVYAKAGGYDWLYMTEGNNVTAQASFNLATGVLGTVSGTGSPSATITPVGNGWYRCTLTLTPIASPHNIQFRPNNANGGGAFAGNGTSGIYIYGAQLEAGAFATSYIPTVASQVTRTADQCSIVAPNFAPWYNQSEGTFVASFDMAGGSAALSSNRAVLVARESATSNHYIYNGSGQVTGWTVVSGVDQAFLTTGAVVADTVTNIAYAYKTNDFAASRNGGTVATDTSGTLPVPTALGIGSNSASSLFLSGHIRSIRYYPTRLTNAQLQALTA